MTVSRGHNDSKVLAFHMIDATRAPRVTTFRVDLDILDRLDAYAARTRRSRNGAVNYLLDIALDYEDAHNPDKRLDR